MLKVNVEDAVQNLKALLEQVARGEEIILVEQDRIVAHLVPHQPGESLLASMQAFREALQITGEPLRTTVIQERQEERY